MSVLIYDGFGGIKKRKRIKYHRVMFDEFEKRWIGKGTSIYIWLCV